MYKIVYLPTSEDIIDGNSTYNNPKPLIFTYKKDAKAFMSKHYFYKTRAIKEQILIYSSTDSDSDRKKIRKYLIEIIKVEDV